MLSNEEAMRALLWKIYKHLFYTGHQYRRRDMKKDIETVLNIKDGAKGEVWQSHWNSQYEKKI